MAAGAKRTTILDIAGMVGVSAATVSRALNNAAYPVRSSLRRRILAAAAEIDYRPNIFGQMLKGGVNKVVGIIVPSITNPFYAQLVADVERHCVAAGYAPIICGSYNSSRLEQGQLETLFRQQVAGILLSTINSSDAFIRKLEASPVPCVLFDQPLAGFRGNSVVFDFREGGRLAARHLASLGHRRIAFASRSLDRASRRLIYAGYGEALAEAGLEPDSALVLTAGEEASAPADLDDYGVGRRLGERIADGKGRHGAVAASNDIIAVGIMNALRERGLSVPGDVSVLGFDDVGLAAMVTPGLTTIRQSTSRTADLAARLLFRSIGTPGIRPDCLELGPELVVRGSAVAAGGPGKRRKRHG